MADETDINRILPPAFVHAYEQLWVAAFGDEFNKNDRSTAVAALGRTTGRPTGQARVSSNEVTSIRLRGEGIVKRVDRTSSQLRDEAAFNLRIGVDKRLRRLAREIASALENRARTGKFSVVKADVIRKCSGKCGRFCDKEASYCSNCGAPTREVDGE